tara:strand:- start:2358 stop:2762 length:405 start_codon:yes stop_codon:yes gene_type:complete
MARSQKDKRSQAWKEVFVNTFKTLPIVRVATRSAGVSREAVRLALENDPEFAKDVEDAKEEGIEGLEIKAWEDSRKERGERILMFLLKSLKPEVYGDKSWQQLEHQVSGGKFTIKLAGEEELPNFIEQNDNDNT